jgi:hypothetical protein
MNVSSVAFSLDGRWLASGSWDKIVKIWEVATGREVRTLAGHTDLISGLAFSPDGRWLASSSYDGSTGIWNAENGMRAALLIATREGSDWLVITPEGLFDGSSQGMQTLVAWRIDNHIYPPDKFFADFYVPGLLTRIFAGQQLKPQINLAGLKLPPDVRIMDPTTGSALQQASVNVSVEAKDLGGGIAEVRLYHNEKQIAVRQGTRGPRSTYTFAVTLIPGENILKAIALDTERVESNADVVRITLDVSPPAKPVLHVLAVGISRYEDAAFNLEFARPDAEAIGGFFAKPGGRLFRSVDSKGLLLFDRDATKAGILQALNQMADRAQPEDIVLIYIAGHGVGLAQQFYFLPYEMRHEADEEAAVRKYGIPATALGEVLSRTRALKEVVIIDACNAGNALPVLAKALTSRGLGDAETKAVWMLARSRGVYLIAASTKQQDAIEIPALRHGVLAYALLNGLEKDALAGADGIVTVHSVLQYIDQKVPELTERYHGGDKQYPVSSDTGMDFPLWIR